MNQVFLKGNLARDPEQRFTPKGTATCSFDIAVNRKWNDQNGQLKEEVSFFRCEAWGKTSETICQYFKKGRPILIQGRIKQDTWDDKTTGLKRSAVKVVVDRCEFCGESRVAKDDSDHSVSRAEATNTEAARDENPLPSDDDVPF